MTEREKMTGRQRRQIKRLGRIHDMGSVDRVIAEVSGVKRRQVRREGVTEREAAAVIRGLSVGTSMAHVSGHDTAYRRWIVVGLVVAFVSFVVAQTYWWGWAALAAVLLATCYLIYRGVREWIEDHFWRASRTNRRERFGTNETGYGYDL